MILLCAEGLQSKEVAERLGVHELTAGKWRRWFVQDGIEGLNDEYRSGRPRTASDSQVAQVIEHTLNSTPKDATHWSIRSMAAETGLSHTTIRRIWSAFGLQPHRSQTFKLSTDPLFVDKVQDIVGLNMSSPNRAVVLCVDEKSQIQALDREQPVLPMAPGVAERRTRTALSPRWRWPRSIGLAKAVSASAAYLLTPDTESLRRPAVPFRARPHLGGGHPL